MRLIAALLTAAFLTLPFALPAAAGVVRVGLLTCAVDGGPGFIVVSRKTLSCRFDSLSHPDEVYDGSISKLGIDVGATGAERLVWAVFAPSKRVASGALTGTYVGVTAQATPAVGLGANVLLGGWERSIILQPLSLTGQLGVNIAAGVAALRLDEPAPAVFKR